MLKMLNKNFQQKPHKETIGIGEVYSKQQRKTYIVTNRYRKCKKKKNIYQQKGFKATVPLFVEKPFALTIDRVFLSTNVISA